jgi:biopolymer transport protein ExbD
VDKPPPKAFDVWFQTANTVYKGVPYNVVAEWTGQGRLGAPDLLRPAGTTDPWVRLDTIELLADYLPRPPAGGPAPVGTDGAAAAGELPELDHEPHIRRPHDEDDDVDMIPLIDISMVLLVFFIMMKTSGAVSPVAVPEMRYAGELSKNDTALTVSIEKSSETRVRYAVRVGEMPVAPENDNLGSSAEAVAVVVRLAQGVPAPREVRVACEKDLPSKLVIDLLRDLEPVREKNGIKQVTGEVNEAPNK